jgi:hypothetical protein
MTTANKKGHVPRENVALTTVSKDTSNGADAQRARLLAALETGPVSTIEARRDLDIMMPAARVHELRHRQGKNILMTRVPLPTDGGRLHSVALYVLLPDAQTDLFDAFVPPSGHHTTALTL